MQRVLGSDRESYRTMGRVLIKNNTSRAIHIRVTNEGDNGNIHFFDVNSGATESWGRLCWQIATVLRDDNGKTEVFVVKPGEAYTVS